jgi:hypothetical protein
MKAYYSQCEDCGWKAIAASPEDLRLERDAHEEESYTGGPCGYYHHTLPVEEYIFRFLDLEVLAWIYTADPKPR